MSPWLGEKVMRFLQEVVLCIFLGGCYASSQEVRAKLGDDYIGKSVDALVLQFGPPASQFKMSTGETSYLWQLSSHTNVDVTRDRFGSSGTASIKFCKINVIASPNGMVTKLTTEDGSVGRTEAIGNFDIHGSVCAHYMGIRKG
jgi:hypothetical protein